MKPFFTTFLFLLLGQAQAQTTTAERLAKNWIYAGTEEFSVVQPPDSTQKKDALQFATDGTYQRIISGKTSSGTWKLNESAQVILLTDAKSKKVTSYNLKSVTATNLVIEYQSPDLVRTRYHFKAAE
jgi:hypothetical protein